MTDPNRLTNPRYTRPGIGAVLLMLALAQSPAALAHCDALDGPVVLAAQRALELRDVTPVLKWIKPEHEPEIRAAFAQASTVRALGADAAALADRYFFETLVRVHRAGEGEAYTGLKPAGSVEPGILAADAALHGGSGEELSEELARGISTGISERFELARERAVHADEDIAAGREYVEAYVDYIHYVEAVHRLVTEGVSHLHHAPAEAP